MPDFIDLLQVALNHPLGQQAVGHLSRRLMGADEETVQRQREERLDRLFERQTALLERLEAAAPAGTSAAVASVAVVETPQGDIAQVLSRLTAAGASVDEALRFVREDGVDHPEAQRRLARAQEDLVVLERVDLRPSALAGLPEGQRRAVEANMQAIREARQALHNAPGGGPPTPDSIAQAAARLEGVTTQLRVAKVVEEGVTNTATPVGPQTPASPGPVTNTATPYSRYAPDMEVSVGCLPCGRAHLAGTVGAMKDVAAKAVERGMGDPEVQAGILAAQKELVALWQDDWTEEKVQASPEADRAIMEEAIPRLRAAQARLEAAQTPEDVAAVTEELVETREAFMAADIERSARPSAPPLVAAIGAVPALVTKALPAGAGTHRVDPPDWLYSAPTPVDIAATTVQTDAARAFDSLVGALAQRGVKVKVRNLWSDGESVTEGAFNPALRTIVMAPAALSKDAYSVQVLAHEAAHALGDVPPCHTYNEAELPYDERAEEDLARDVSVVALVEAGLPIELANGYELEPGEREVDYTLLQTELPPDVYAKLRWEARWISDALTGAPRDYAAQECPPTRIEEVEG
jgi:hypothetical protein